MGGAEEKEGKGAAAAFSSNPPSFAGTNFGCTNYGKREGGRGLQIVHRGRKNWEDVKVFPEKTFLTKYSYPEPRPVCKMYTKNYLLNTHF